MAVQIHQSDSTLIGTRAFSDEEYRQRLARVRALMTERDLEALLSFSPENMYYMTGHDSPGYYYYQACVITHDQVPINVLRRVEGSNTLDASWSRRAVLYADKDDPVRATVDLLAHLGLEKSRIGVEMDCWFIPPYQHNKLTDEIRASGGDAIDASGLIEELRVVKSDEEVSYIREAARIASHAVKVGFVVAQEGANENDIAAAILGDLTLNGSEYAGLPPFITSGPRTSLLHTTWSGRRLRRGDAIGLEIPAVRRRYVASLYRCGVVGDMDNELSRHAACVLDTLSHILQEMKPGNTPDRIHAIHRSVFEEHGLGHLLGTRSGYSMGINYPPDWGEGNVMALLIGDERPLQPGMVFHVLPHIIVRGKFGFGISETVLITGSGHEVLTDHPREIVVV